MDGHESLCILSSLIKHSVSAACLLLLFLFIWYYLHHMLSLCFGQDCTIHYSLISLGGKSVINTQQQLSVQRHQPVFVAGKQAHTIHILQICYQSAQTFRVWYCIHILLIFFMLQLILFLFRDCFLSVCKQVYKLSEPRQQKIETQLTMHPQKVSAERVK